MGLIDTFSDELEKSVRYSASLPLDKNVIQINHDHSTDFYIFTSAIFIAYLLFKKYKHKVKTPINRVSLLIFIPSFIVFMGLLSHEFALCHPKECIFDLWHLITGYEYSKYFRPIGAIAITSFVLTFLYDETFDKLYSWIKNG